MSTALQYLLLGVRSPVLSPVFLIIDWHRNNDTTWINPTTTRSALSSRSCLGGPSIAALAADSDVLLITFRRVVCFQRTLLLRMMVLTISRMIIIHD